jgi:hypothetical protein
MEEVQTEMPLRLSTVDGDITTVAIIDRETERWLRKTLEHKTAVDVKVREPEGDVIGHQATADTIVVVVSLPDDDDDVSGHAMSLRFPDMAAAKDFERRMLATGLLVATVAAGAAGVGIASQTRISAPAGPLAAPDPGQYAPTIRDRDRDLSTPAQYAPTVRDTDRDLNAPAPAPYVPTYAPYDTQTQSQEQAPYNPTYAPYDTQAQSQEQAPYNPTYAPFDTQAQAQGTDEAQYAPTVRDNDKDISGSTARPSREVHGDRSAPPAASTSDDQGSSGPTHDSGTRGRAF